MPSNYIEGFNEEEKVELVLKVCPVTKKKKKNSNQEEYKKAFQAKEEIHTNAQKPGEPCPV